MLLCSLIESLSKLLQPIIVRQRPSSIIGTESAAFLAIYFIGYVTPIVLQYPHKHFLFENNVTQCRI